MTTPIVPNISDEQLAELEDQSLRTRQDSDYTHISYGELRGLIARLRAAEVDVERRGKALSEIMTEVDLNIRPTVRDIINGMPDANDIYGYCDTIDRIAMAVLEPKP
ncbi:hypothetical protein [Leptolyngbya phage Lbo-JY16]